MHMELLVFFLIVTVVIITLLVTTVRKIDKIAYSQPTFLPIVTSATTANVMDRNETTTDNSAANAVKRNENKTGNTAKTTGNSAKQTEHFDKNYATGDSAGNSATSGNYYDGYGKCNNRNVQLYTPEALYEDYDKMINDLVKWRLECERLYYINQIIPSYCYKKLQQRICDVLNSCLPAATPANACNNIQHNMEQIQYALDDYDREKENCDKLVHRIKNNKQYAVTDKSQTVYDKDKETFVTSYNDNDKIETFSLKDTNENGKSVMRNMLTNDEIENHLVSVLRLIVNGKHA